MRNFVVELHQPGVMNPSTGKELVYTLYNVGSGDNDFLLNGTLKLEANKAGTFEFDILPSHSYYSVLRRYIHYICVKELGTGIERDEAIPVDIDPDSIQTLPIEYLGDTQILFYGRILTMSLSFNGTKHAVCEGLMANLLDCPMYVSGAYDNGVTADKIFTIRGTPYNMFLSAINAYRNLVRTDIYPGIIHSDAGSYSFEDMDVSGGTSVGDFITSELVEAHGGFLDMEYKQFTNGSIVGFLHWAPDPSMSSYDIEAIDQEIEFGVNLLDLTAENSEDEICTGIIPTWDDANDEKKWTTTRGYDVDFPDKNIYKPYVVGTNSGVAAAGIKIVDIPCTKTQEQAISYANTYVTKYCDYELAAVDFDSYTVRALDMHYVNEESKHKIGLYNRVNIKCVPHSINKVLLCTSIEILLDSPENSSYTFSVYRPKASSNEKTLTRQLNGRTNWNKVQSDVAKVSSRTAAQEQAGYITQETDPTVPSWAKQSNKPSYTASEVGALSTSDVANNLTTTSEGKVLDARQGKALKDLVDTALTSSDVANNLTTTEEGKVLDARQGKSLKELVDAIPAWAKQSNKPTYTASDVGALSSSDVVNNLTTTEQGKVLDARQGKRLKDLIDNVSGGGVSSISFSARPDDEPITGDVDISEMDMGFLIKPYSTEELVYILPDETVNIKIGEFLLSGNESYGYFEPVGTTLLPDVYTSDLAYLDAYVYIVSSTNKYEVYVHAHSRKSTGAIQFGAYVFVLYHGTFTYN